MCRPIEPVPWINLPCQRQSINMAAPENFRFSGKIPNPNSICKVLIYERYGKISGRAYSGKIVCYHPFLFPPQIFSPTGQFPYPEMVCPCGLRLFSGAPLSGGDGPGFIDRRPTKNFRTKEVVCSKSAKKYILMEISAILLTAGRLGKKRGPFSGFPPRWKVPDPFLTAVAKVAA